MKIKFAMTVCACALALWGCGDDGDDKKPDAMVSTPDSAVIKLDGPTVKLDGGADTLPGDATVITDTKPGDAPQILDVGAKDVPSTDVPQTTDAAGDASADADASDARG